MDREMPTVCFACMKLTEHNFEARRPCMELGHSPDAADPVTNHACAWGRALQPCLDCGTLVVAEAC